MAKKKNIFAEEKPSLGARIGAPFAAVKKTLGGKWYDFTARLHARRRAAGTIAVRSMTRRRRAQNLFLFCVLVIPVLQFCVFYIGVNINSILLAFQEYHLDTGKYTFTGWVNFSRFISDLKDNYVLTYATKNSFLLYFVGLLISMPLQVMSSYFVYKKIPLSGFFKVFLYLPSLVSSIVMTIMFKYFVDLALPTMLKMMGVENVPNFFYDTSTAFPTIVFYNVWFGLGGGIILYTGAMSRIPDSLVEYGMLEGMTLWQEFWKVTVPLIFSTITVFLVTGVAGIFTNQAGVYNFFSGEASQDLYTYGYFLFVRVIGTNGSLSQYPYASAAGLLFTLIAAPVTLIVKWALEKFGPSAEF